MGIALNTFLCHGAAWNEGSLCCITQFDASNVDLSQHHARVNVVDGVGIYLLTCNHVPEVDRGCEDSSTESAEGIGHQIGFSRQVAQVSHELSDITQMPCLTSGTVCTGSG